MRPGRPRLALCDDLSGAAEAALALSGGHDEPSARLAPPVGNIARFAQDLAAEGSTATGPCAIDLDIRQSTPDEARSAVGALTPRSGPLFLKIDSLLRGNVAPMVWGLRDRRDSLIVCTPALPAAGRATVNGRVVFAAHSPVPGPGEPRPSSIQEALGELPTDRFGLDTVRSAGLVAGLAEAARTRHIAVCDAETDADLDLIAAACAGVPDVIAVGSAGLAAAFGRLRSAAEPDPAPVRACGDSPAARPSAAVLVVVGSAEPGARRQVEILEHAGAAVVLVDPTTRRETGSCVRARLDHGCVVLAVRQAAVAPDEIDPGSGRLITDHLAAIVRSALAEHDTPVRLALTGGETARRVLDALGVTRLDLLGQVHPGAVHARTDTHHEIVTRPGSHGGPDSLLTIARHLRHTDHQEDP
ncbi:nucleotide-binding domain containing protein [Actinoalloteichus fjordicus]|uniref:4-hydroxythreonine-4-phosphate dehydrogenase n=1 Tax=Actinoalloteichus fjordicus TaxID=1612552 RepID=A0AAC9PPV7_9PSEU|nr:nucleotide-binding domain containing protein [Actinoalloteichus fjordicus]APU12277.1 hypothetical protein UA74_00920 [Actinoalloteichus fjordicus]